MDSGFVWQCECGHIEYEEAFPEDCSKCLRVGQFAKIPEDMIDEKAAEEVLSYKPEKDEDEE